MAEEISSCAVSSSRVWLRPSALAAQTERLKFSLKSDGDDTPPSSSSQSTSHQAGSATQPESTTADSTNGSNSHNVAPQSTSSNLFAAAPEDSSAPGFVFGQNLHERVMNYEESVSSSSSVEAPNLSFENAAQRTEETSEPTEACIDKNKTLEESANEYQSKQVKRKYDEVTVVTGEEEESNVLQFSGKLFSFEKSTSNWIEKGRGCLRLNDQEIEGSLQSRIVMRTQGSLRVILNTKVWPGMVIEKPSPKSIRVSAFESEGVKVFLIMANPKDVDQLYSALDWRITTLRSRSNHQDNDNPLSPTTDSEGELPRKKERHSPFSPEEPYDRLQGGLPSVSSDDTENEVLPADSTSTF